MAFVTLQAYAQGQVKGKVIDRQTDEVLQFVNVRVTDAQGRLAGGAMTDVRGTFLIDRLKDGDRILLMESCTHNVTCEDIGRVKIPHLLSKHTGRQLHFDIVAGLSQPERPMTDYALVIQCGGCVVTPKQLASRLAPAIAAGVPVSNYGLTLAYLNGIFQRSMAVFGNSREQ